jgi:hypothetical protein
VIFRHEKCENSFVVDLVLCEYQLL